MTGVIYRPEAVADIVEASAWYARQKDGLGEEFLSAVSDTAVVFQRSHCNMQWFIGTRAAPWSGGFPMACSTDCGINK